MHRCYVQTGLLLFVCYCWRSKFIAKIFSSPAPSWFAWNVKIIDDFPIFLIVISVLHQTRHILKDFSSCPCPSKFFLHPQHSCCWHFSKNASYASSSASFTFPSILSDLELPELFNFELLLEDLLQWLFVFDDNFEHHHPHLFSSIRNASSSWSWKSVHPLHQTHSSPLLICSSSIFWLHFSCSATTNFRMSLRAKFCKSGAGGHSLIFRFLSLLDIW